MEREEAAHLLLHALSEESVQQELDAAKSQQEVYAILQQVEYFTLTMEEFQSGIELLSQSDDKEK